MRPVGLGSRPSSPGLGLPGEPTGIGSSPSPEVPKTDGPRRHVALLIQQGTHPSVIAARLGHTSVTSVLDVYGHLSEGLDRDAADTLEPPWSESDVHAMWTRRTERRNTERGLS